MAWASNTNITPEKGFTSTNSHLFMRSAEEIRPFSLVHHNLQEKVPHKATDKGAPQIYIGTKSQGSANQYGSGLYSVRQSLGCPVLTCTD